MIQTTHNALLKAIERVRNRDNEAYNKMLDSFPTQVLLALVTGDVAEGPGFNTGCFFMYTLLTESLLEKEIQDLENIVK